MVHVFGSYEGSLYVLQGSIIIGLVAIFTSMLDSHTIQLWHMCLGHISEKGMNIRSKKGLLCNQSIGKLEFCEHYIFGK